MSSRLKSLNRAKRAPPELHWYVGRHRLRLMLSGGLRRKLTVICASSGFGKTTLLYDFLQESDARISWFRLDETDRDTPQFASYLIAAFEEHYPGSGRRSMRAVQRLDQSPASHRNLAGVLANDLCQLPYHQFVIALDGYESVNCSPGIAELVSYLLKYTPPQIHFFVTSREIPSLPMTRLRAQDDLLEIGARDLAFTKVEADSLIDQFEGVSLERSERR